MDFVPVGPGELDLFEGAYRILCASIPSGLKTFDALLATLSRPDYLILVAVESGVVVGVAILFVPGGADAPLLEYLAVDEAKRGGGIGRRLFVEGANLAFRASPGMPMLIEVDTDEIAKDGAGAAETPSPEQSVKTRRRIFYERLGCRRVSGCRYQLPIGEGPPPAMDLMAFFWGPGGDVSKAELGRWLSVIYERVYGCASDDPRVDQMLEPVADPVEFI